MAVLQILMSGVKNVLFLSEKAWKKSLHGGVLVYFVVQKYVPFAIFVF